MKQHRRGHFYFFRKIISSLTLLCFTAQPILTAAQVIADPNAGQKKPTIDSTANGLPLVQITTPSAAGVSHNQYQQFNVDQQGLILNNSRTVTQTQQAGYIDGNPNLVNGSARIILNEVTSTNPSFLRGYTEVAGQKAEVIIANPNGITCNGCGFINTSRGVLTTGVPIMSNGNLDALQVNGGNIQIEGLGFNAANLDQADLIARSVSLNAQVWAQYLNVVTGTNRVDYTNLNAQALTPDINKPQFAIDVAALGGMYANRIRLVGTENGVGVNSQGSITSVGELIITTEGRVLLSGDTTAGGNLSISAKENITHSGNLYSENTLNITTQAALENSGLVASAGNTTINAQNVNSVGTLGAGINSNQTFSTAGDLVVNASATITAQNQNLAVGKISFLGTSLNLESAVNQAGSNITFNASSGDINLKSGVTLAGGNFTAITNGVFSNNLGAIRSAGDTAITADNIDNRSGNLSTSNLVMSAANGVNNQNGTLYATQDLTLTQPMAIFNNSNGNIAANNNLNIKAAEITNTLGQIAADQDVTVNAGSLIGSGKLIAGRDLVLTLNSDFTYTIGDEITANRDFNFMSSGKLINSSTLTTPRNLQINVGNLTNENGATIAAGTLSATVTNTLVNNGTIDSDTVAMQSGSLENAGSITGANINLKATDIINKNSAALIAGTENVRLFANNISNLDGANIYSLGDIVIAGDESLNKANSMLNRSSTVQADGDVSIYANQIKNKKSVFVTEEKITSSEFGADPIGDSELLIYANVVTETNVIQNSESGKILAGGNITLKGSIENNISTIAAGGDITFDAGTLNNISIGTRTTTKNGTVMQLGGCVTLECAFFGTCSCDTTGSPYSSTTVEAINTYPATFIANGAISGSALTINNITVDASGTPVDSIANSIPGQMTPIDDQSVLVGNPIGNNFTLPSNALFTIYPEPDQKYLIETNPRFTDYRNFISSDYMLQQISYDPAQMIKRLGDGFYESQLILSEITQLTGRRFLDGYTSSEQQFQGLMDNGITNAEKFQLKVGIALDANQMAQLTSDMVWMVEQEIKGHKVLVPIVYLAHLKDRDLKSSGSLIAANDIQLFASSDLKNNGMIKSRNRTEIIAQNVINRGGMINSGNATLISAQNDILNQSGEITGDDVSLRAGRDIKNETLIQTLVNHIVTTTKIGKRAEINTRSNLNAEAGRDIVMLGAKISAGKDALLNAGRNLEIGTAEKKERIATTFYLKENTTHLISDVQTGGTVNLVAKNDTKFEAAQIASGKDLNVISGGNVTISTIKDNAIVDKTQISGRNYNRMRTEDETVIGSNLLAQGKVTIAALPSQLNQQNSSAGNVLIEGSNVSAGSGAVIAADKDVTIKEIGERHSSLSESSSTKKKKFGGSKTSSSRTEIETNLAIGSGISGDTVQISSGKDLTVQGSNVLAAGKVALSAAEDVTIEEATETYHRLFESQQTKSKNAGTSKKTTKSGSETDATYVVSSTISGDTVQINAGKDLNVQGSHVVGTSNVSFSAADNVAITSAQETTSSSSYRSVKKSGMLGSGGVATFGTQRQKKTADETSVTQVGSTVGSVEGNVTVNAGKDYKQVGSDILAAADLSVTAQNISVEAAYNTSVYKETTQFKQGGMTVGVGAGSITSPLLDIQSSDKRRHEVEDKRLKALYAYKELHDLYDMGGAVKNLIGGDFKDAASVKIDFGSSSSKSESISKSSVAVGSNLNGRNVSLVATGDKNITNSGNLAIIGSNVNGQDILLSAANDVTLQSAENKFENNTKNKSKSGSLGVSIGYTGEGAGITFSVQGSMSKGRTDGNSLTHTETQIDAAQTLTVKSGRDTNLIGAQAKGDKIVTEVGRDLNIVSEQDIETYKGKQTSVSGGLSYSLGAGGVGGNFSINQSKTNSNYQGVQEQSGFFAGKEGFDINVKGNTDLKGAVIASNAEAAKNKLSTETLTYSDIENKAEYKASSVGISVSNNGVMPNISPVSKGKSNSMTLASIAQGSIEIRSDKNKPEDQKTDLSKLSRDPATAHKTLDKIFDQKKIEEKQELAKVFGQEAFKVVGDIAKHFTKPHDDAELKKTVAERYLELKNKGVLNEKESKQLARFESGPNGLNPENATRIIDQANQDIVTYQEQYDAWKEGSTNKILLHTFVGAVQAGLGGGDAFAGGVGAGAGESARQLTQNLPLALQQWASVAIGAAAAKLTGDMQSGAAASLDGERYNRQLHLDELQKIKQLAKGDKEKELRLIAAACAIVHCGDEKPSSDPTKAADIRAQEKGQNYLAEQQELKAIGGGLFEYGLLGEAKDAISRNELAAKAATFGFLNVARVADKSLKTPAGTRLREAGVDTLVQVGGLAQASGAVVTGATGVGLAITGGATCLETGVGCLVGAAGVGLVLWSVDQGKAGVATYVNRQAHGTYGGQYIEETFHISSPWAELSYSVGPSLVSASFINMATRWGAAEGQTAGAVEEAISNNKPGSFVSWGDDYNGAPYFGRNTRNSLENKFGPENVKSTTVPPENAPNVRYAGQTYRATGIVFDQRGYPIFDDVAKYEARFDYKDFSAASYDGQMRMATRRLREEIAQGKVSASLFDENQLKQIRAGNEKIDGFTWHHHQDKGRIQLIPEDIHSRTRHVGGESMSKGK